MTFTKPTIQKTECWKCQFDKKVFNFLVLNSFKSKTSIFKTSSYKVGVYVQLVIQPKILIDILTNFPCLAEFFQHIILGVVIDLRKWTCMIFHDWAVTMNWSNSTSLTIIYIFERKWKLLCLTLFKICFEKNGLCERINPVGSCTFQTLIVEMVKRFIAA